MHGPVLDGITNSHGDGMERNTTLGQDSLGRREPSTEPQEAQLKSCSEESSKADKERSAQSKEGNFLLNFNSKCLYIFI